MGKLYRNLCIVLAVIVFFAWQIYPPQEKLRLGRDLAGGVTLIYQLDIGQDEDAKKVVADTIDVLKRRVDPDGLLEISMVSQGRDRIEISMPLPRQEVKDLKQKYEDELARLARTGLTRDKLDQFLALSGEERAKRAADLSEGNPKRKELLDALMKQSDDVAFLRLQLEKAKQENAPQSEIDALVDAAGGADLKLEDSTKAVLATVLPAAEVRQALTLSERKRTIEDEKGEKEILPSDRERALERIREAYPDAKDQLDQILKTYKAYADKRTTLDDPQDLVRMLQGAGVLTFRITVEPGKLPQEAELRRDLRAKGPRGARSPDAVWCKINQIDGWVRRKSDLADLKRSPEEFFRMRGHVGDEYQGQYYLLCWDVKGNRLTRAEGDWRVANSSESRDERGLPAIAFVMDPRGATLLGDMTKDHVNEKMAVLLDDEVYTAPNLHSAISKSGQITGEFSAEERRYVIRVLGAGSLQAKLSSEPISVSAVGPELGADNLNKGLKTGVIAFSIVAGFMVVYYFGCGVIAVFALACTGVIILGAMALNKAAFTMPGIAGVVLTFGQAVDANVLIYERMREELRRGDDMRSAVRIGFRKAMPAIMDANVSHLIICFVLYNFGTQEIRGFAIVLGVGVVATLFSALVVSHVVFDFFVQVVGWKNAKMLPIVLPGLQRVLEPKINWIGLRPVFLTLSAIVMIVSLGLVYVRGSDTFDTEFRGGTQVTLELKRSGPGGARMEMTRHEVEGRLRAIKPAPGEVQLGMVQEAEVLPINPKNDGVTSSTFRLKSTAQDSNIMLSAVRAAFVDVIDSEPELTFEHSEAEDLNKAPLHRVYRARLGDVIGPIGGNQDVRAYQGGVAIVLDNIKPAPSLEDLTDRIARERRDPQFADTLDRKWEVRILKGTQEAVQSAVVLVIDPGLTFADNEALFDQGVATREWTLTRTATTQARSLASVESFSAAVASTFAGQAIMATGLSLLLLVVYIWLRYGTLRWSLAAVLPLVHDIVALLGLLALSQILQLAPATQAIASSLGILPFRIDLNMVAALLMITGFSLNDKVIILDRIRENRGRAQYATSQVTNDSINQTISRTLITSGTTLMTTVILYIFGGEGVRGFAYAFTMGVILGTYSSIALAAPFVWSRRTERRSEVAPVGTATSLARA